MKRTASQRQEMYNDTSENKNDNGQSCSDDNSDGSLEVILVSNSSTDTVARNKNTSRNNKNSGPKRRRMDNRR